ncbi:MAG TPA: hypothetical protein VKW78_09990 [Terriglobales bacterium]|nr:hypothetical protein [Terriglobales bacterium]
MRVHIITEGAAVVGYQVIENANPAPGQFRSGLMAGPGQKLHEVELPEDFATVPGPEEIHKRLTAYIQKKAAA